jgi:hypothetical protein
MGSCHVSLNFHLEATLQPRQLSTYYNTYNVHLLPHSIGKHSSFQHKFSIEVPPHHAICTSLPCPLKSRHLWLAGQAFDILSCRSCDGICTPILFFVLTYKTQRAAAAAAAAAVVAGGSHEGYVKWACVAAAARGWRAVVLNMRGCNGVPITSARGYNAINTGDLHVAVQSIRRSEPHQHAFVPVL